MTALPTKSPNPPPTPIAAGMDAAATSAPVWTMRDWISQPVVASFVSGGVAGAVSRTVVSPLERLKILLQVQAGAQSEYKNGIWKALQKIWREEGMKGMLAGNGTNCIRIVPYSAVQFGSYNVYKPLVGGFKFDAEAQASLLTRKNPVLRILSRRTTSTRTTTLLRCTCGHHIGHSHLPARYRPHAAIHPVRLFRETWRQGCLQEASGNVADVDEHV